MWQWKGRTKITTKSKMKKIIAARVLAGISSPRNLSSLRIEYNILETEENTIAHFLGGFRLGIFNVRDSAGDKMSGPKTPTVNKRWIPNTLDSGSSTWESSGMQRNQPV